MIGLDCSDVDPRRLPQRIPLQGYWDKSVPAKCWVNNRD